jgi:hypothetical protein
VRRALVALLATVVLVAGLGALLYAFNSRDDAGVGSGGARTTAGPGPGQLQPDRGDRHLAAGEHAAASTGGTPPTSGPHHPTLPTHDAQALDDNQILHALELGDVILFYDARRPPAPLRALQRDVSGAFDAEVAAAGQQVILARRPGTGPVTAAAWRRLLHVDDPADPALRRFAEAWIGVGAPR